METPFKTALIDGAGKNDGSLLGCVVGQNRVQSLHPMDKIVRLRCDIRLHDEMVDCTMGRLWGVAPKIGSLAAYRTCSLLFFTFLCAYIYTTYSCKSIVNYIVSHLTANIKTRAICTNVIGSISTSTMDNPHHTACRVEVQPPPSSCSCSLSYNIMVL